MNVNNLCPRCRVNTRPKRASGQYSSACNPCEANRTLDSRRAHPKRWILRRLKMNAKIKAIVFNLKETDIPDFPKFCPVLPWIELTYEVGKGQTGGLPSGGSISVDRIDTSKGYVRDNIRLISDRANRLKSDASDQELIALGKDAERRLKEPLNV